MLWLFIPRIFILLWLFIPRIFILFRLLIPRNYLLLWLLIPWHFLLLWLFIPCSSWCLCFFRNSYPLDLRHLLLSRFCLINKIILSPVSWVVWFLCLLSLSLWSNSRCYSSSRCKGSNFGCCTPLIFVIWKLLFDFSFFHLLLWWCRCFHSLLFRWLLWYRWFFEQFNFGFLLNYFAFYNFLSHRGWLNLSVINEPLSLKEIRFSTLIFLYFNGLCWSWDGRSLCSFAPQMIVPELSKQLENL